MVHKVKDFEHYKQLVANCEVKGVLTNNYMMPTEIETHLAGGVLEYVATEHNLALLLNKGICYRVYYHLQDMSEILELPADNEYAIEILYRGDNFYPQQEVDYWQKCGFTPNLIRDFYMGKITEMQMYEVENGAEISVAKTVGEAKFAVDLFNSSFDPYTGDFVSDEEIPALLEDGSISVARQNGVLVGACHAYERNKVMYFAHLAVAEQARGKKLSRALMQEMIERLKRDDKTRYSLWVQRQNAAAVTLYQNLGYKYSNKSTISLLKLIQK